MIKIHSLCISFYCHKLQMRKFERGQSKVFSTKYDDMKIRGLQCIEQDYGSVQPSNPNKIVSEQTFIQTTIYNNKHTNNRVRQKCESVNPNLLVFIGVRKFTFLIQTKILHTYWKRGGWGGCSKTSYVKPD